MIFKRQFEWAINSLKKNNEVIKEISIGKFDNYVVSIYDERPTDLDSAYFKLLYLNSECRINIGSNTYTIHNKGSKQFVLNKQEKRKLVDFLLSPVTNKRYKDLNIPNNWVLLLYLYNQFNSKYVKDESVYKLNYEDLINLNNYPCGYIPLDTPMPDYLHLK